MEVNALTLVINFAVILITVGGVALRYESRLSKMEAHQADLRADADVSNRLMRELFDRVPPAPYFEDLMRRVQHLEERAR